MLFLKLVNILRWWMLLIYKMPVMIGHLCVKNCLFLGNCLVAGIFFSCDYIYQYYYCNIYTQCICCLHFLHLYMYFHCYLLFICINICHVLIVKAFSDEILFDSPSWKLFIYVWNVRFLKKNSTLYLVIVKNLLTI